MGAEQHIGRIALDKKGVLHVACRMVGGKIERGKNVPVILDFRTFGNGESKAGKDVDDLVADNVERMT